MESKRQLKFARQIQKDLADLFQQEGSSFFPNNFVTVTKVRVTPDLGLARIYLSFLNTTTAQQSINSVKAQQGEIRYKLGKRIKDQVRVIPELEFFIDDTQEYVSKMNKLFEEIEKQPKSSSSEE
ncbi:Ribosome-binding factor A [compost metagenome]|uniref:Ribosome-binding factor A n=1 Tax=Solitalea canadensis (strain ATCC 29591 / DSM 3403 / JCM 21819 / LMG 8368 / NBRC 15130 / NCIMB 12057 / USAM 9D) TaxID=929556 RepID=H8KKY1_SOLCM|nr:30S ribosome-binding factor RbfA [Solitalea canadensis]AFD08798.1 ribosome-binding factor A [Solitalea canadensis DSM 3403]